MKNAKELREITNSQRKILFEKAKQIIFKDIELSADRGRDNYTLDVNNVVYIDDDVWFKLKKPEFETIKNELKANEFILKHPSADYSKSEVIVSW